MIPRLAVATVATIGLASPLVAQAARDDTAAAAPTTTVVAAGTTSTTAVTPTTAVIPTTAVTSPTTMATVTAPVTSPTTTTSTTVPATSAAAPTDQPACAGEAVTAAALDAAFADGVTTLDGMVGADYQRTLELPDGRVLWTFQDTYLVDPADPADDRDLIHNSAMVQDGMCFTALHGGTDAEPTAWIAAEQTVPFEHWYWPLDGYVLDADTAVLFLAEMSERGPVYLDYSVPVATWTVELDLVTGEVGELQPAPDPGTALYGFSVASDGEYVYLYAQCHRQFGFSELGHDLCTTNVYVARQPLGQTTQPLQYWNGAEWVADASAAVNVANLVAPDGDDRHVNPMQVERTDSGWIAVTDVDDWWGTEIYVDVADDPQGPWTTVAVFVPDSGAGTTEFASYFASVIPTDDDQLVIAVGTNRWDGTYSERYRPNFNTVDLTA